MFVSPSKAAALSSSTAASAATFPAPKRSWLSSSRNSPRLRSSPMSDYTVLHERPEVFYDVFERKAELQHQTHYCPGCGHGIVHKLLAEAVDSLGIQDRMVLIS